VADQVVRGESSEFLLNAYSAKPLSAGSAPTAVQGYEAGEHARLGETQAELKKTLSAPTAYTVVKGETLKVIATRFGLAVDELKEANKTKLRKWPANDGSGNLVEGFNAGETITIPAKLNELAETATKDPSAKFTVNGVVLDYGVGIAMGDLFENPAEMAKASPEELKELAALINRERSGGKAVSTDEWQKATKGRYLKLAEKNAAHFAPTNAARVATTTAGAASPNHKATWETHHKSALDASQAGNKDQALSTNAFGDHFLTDAFSAGHLINKADVMESFKSQLKLDAKGKDFTPASQAFFDDVAKTVFVGNVKTEFSKFEAADAYALGWHPNVNSDSRFSTLLQGIHKEKPDLLANAVAKGVHDGLNTLPGGLPVVNAKGGKWNLSGDGTLNAQTTAIAREAVAQSQSNIVSVFKTTTKVDYPVLYKKVWDYTPEPDPDGMKQLSAVVSKGSSTTSPELKKSIVDLIKSNYLLLIAELVKLKKLRKA
jgi:LysM domain.